jgi:hypothetical protein
VNVRRAWLISLLLLAFAGCVVPGPKPKPPTDPPPAPRYNIVVHVCDGDCAQDHKIAGAALTLQPGVQTATTDLAGNHTFEALTAGHYLVCAEALGFTPDCGSTDVPPANSEIAIELRRAVPPILPLTTDGPIFLAGDQPWRWDGVSAFRLLDAFAHGQDLQPFFDRFRGFNVLRVWLYTSWKDANGQPIGWDPPAADIVLRFLARCRDAGFYVELTLFTDNDPARSAPIRAIVSALAAAAPTNLLIEIANEPDANKIDTTPYRAQLEATPFLYTSGDYDPSSSHFGRYLTYHTPRDNDWPRKSKGLREFWDGSGPDAPGPAIHVPAVADEPIRPDQANYADQDYLAYFALASLAGAGATFHYEGGKWARLPDANEGRCLDAALAGLNAFPADAPRQLYAHDMTDEQATGSLRTYRFGPYGVRVRPKTGAVLIGELPR